MEGYDIDHAAEKIALSLGRNKYPDFAETFDSVIRQAIELDLQYMQESGAISANGLTGNVYYDDDEAFEYILDGIVTSRGWNDEQEIALASLLDDYMDAQQDYMESIGWLAWE